MMDPLTTENRPDLGTFDMSTLKRAIESNDAGLLANLYSDDAEIVVIDQMRPPSNPLVIHGKEEIAAFFEDVCGRAMAHQIVQEVVTPAKIAFTEACEYPDGMKVYCSSVLELANGRVVRQVNVQAWDPAVYVV